MRKNVASQIIGAQLVSASDGSAFTGSVTCYVTGNGGTQAAGSVGSGACAHEGHGFHTYAPAQAETNYDHVAFTFTGAGAVPATVQVYPNFPQTGDSFARVGAPVGASISADIAAVKTQTGAIETDTQDIQSRIPTALVGGRIDATVDGTGMEAGAVTAIQSGLATAAELAKVPKSDSTVTWNATALASINAQCDTALADYDAPTNAEMTARTLAAASYATASAQATAQADLDTLTGSDGVTLATSQPNYAPATAAALVTVDGIVDTIVATTNKLDDTLEDQGGGTYGFTEASLQEAPTGSGGGGGDATEAKQDTIIALIGTPAVTLADDIAGISAGSGPTVEEIADEVQTRTIAAVTVVNGLAANVITAAATAADFTTEIQSGLATATAVADLPTNAELAAALGTADDAVLAAISGLNNLSSAQAQSATAAALTAYDPPTRAELTSDTNSVLSAVGDVPTNAELTSALSSLATSAEVAAVESDTQDIQSRLPAALDDGHIPASIKRVGETTLTAAGTGGQGYGAA